MLLAIFRAVENILYRFITEESIFILRYLFVPQMLKRKYFSHEEMYELLFKVN